MHPKFWVTVADGIKGSYTLEIAGNALEDLAGNTFAGSYNAGVFSVDTLILQLASSVDDVADGGEASEFAQLSADGDADLTAGIADIDENHAIPQELYIGYSSQLFMDEDGLAGITLNETVAF